MAQKFTVPITVKQLASAGSDAVTVYVDADTQARLKIEAGGRLTWGSGASAGDVNLYRSAADTLSSDDTLKVPILFVDGIEIDTTGATTDQALVFNGTKFAPAGAITNFSSQLKHIVKNDDSVTLTKGMVVYTSGANGTNILVKRAGAGSETTSSQVLGFVEADIAVNATGYIVNAGLVAGINTSAATAAGDPIWLSSSVLGGVVYGLASKPDAPNHLVYLGVVTKKNPSTGEIFVHISNGWELDELHNVSAPAPNTGDVLTFNGSIWTAASAGGGASLKVAATAPASPNSGDLWFNSTTLETYIYYDGGWLQASGEPDLVEDLTDLSDVVLTTPVNGQFLKFDGTRWINGTIPTINTLDDIGDVSVASPSSGQFLKWNGSAWVAETIIGGATISDTAPASPLAGQLWFQSTNGKTFVYYDSSWIEVGGIGTGARMVSSSSAPASPLEGSMWFNTNTAQTFVYYDSSWIEIGASGVTASVQDSAPASPVSGQIWFNSLTGGTYVYYGTTWVEVGASPFSALVNTINAKGDLLVGTADNTIGGLTAGSANQVLTVDSSTTTGLKWATPVSTGKSIAMSIVFGGG